jgi:hypothetical protein
MTPPLPKAKLSRLNPSKEELDCAIKHVSELTGSETKSKKIGLKEFLRKNPDTDAETATGANKVKILALFHWHQMQHKANLKKNKSENQTSHAKERIKKLRWLNKEQMESTFWEDL